MLQSIKPLRDLVLVQELPKEDDKSPGGVILPGTARKPIGPVKGTVIKAGALCVDVKEGDVVLFDKFAANELSEGCFSIPEKLILAIQVS